MPTFYQSYHGCKSEIIIADDWDGTYGNPGKLGLSIIGMVFNAIFMVQHFILYPSKLKIKQICHGKRAKTSMAQNV